jgi:hypothetical protein
VLLRVDTNIARSRPLSAFSTFRREVGVVSVDVDSFTAALIRRAPSHRFATHGV